MMVVNLTDQPRFFVGSAISPASWPHFFVGAAIGLAIGGAISTKADVAVGSSRLCLW